MGSSRGADKDVNAAASSHSHDASTAVAPPRYDRFSVAATSAYTTYSGLVLCRDELGCKYTVELRSAGLYRVARVFGRSADSHSSEGFTRRATRSAHPRSSARRSAASPEDKDASKSFVSSRRDRNSFSS